MSVETQEGYIEYDDELEYRKAVKTYIWQCLLMEGSKVIIFFIVFHYFGLTVPFLVALLALMVVRCNGGGLHCRHYTSCLLLSLLVITGCVYFGLHLPIPKYAAVSFLIICSILGYRNVPIVSHNRPEPDEDLVKLSKRRTICIILIYSFVVYFCPYNPYINIGTWTIILHILQLLIAKILQRRKDYE